MRNRTLRGDTQPGHGEKSGLMGVSLLIKLSCIWSGFCSCSQLVLVHIRSCSEFMIGPLDPKIPIPGCICHTPGSLDLAPQMMQFLHLLFCHFCYFSARLSYPFLYFMPRSPWLNQTRGCSEPDCDTFLNCLFFFFFQCP